MGGWVGGSATQAYAHFFHPKERRGGGEKEERKGKGREDEVRVRRRRRRRKRRRRRRRRKERVSTHLIYCVHSTTDLNQPPTPPPTHPTKKRHPHPMGRRRRGRGGGGRRMGPSRQPRSPLLLSLYPPTHPRPPARPPGWEINDTRGRSASRCSQRIQVNHPPTHPLTHQLPL